MFARNFEYPQVLYLRNPVMKNVMMKLHLHIVNILYYSNLGWFPISLFDYHRIM